MRREELAKLVAEFQQRGGAISQCPPGNGLMDPAARTPCVLVGQAKANFDHNEKKRQRVLTALAAAGSLTLYQLRDATGIKLTSLRYAVETLKNLRQITAHGSSHPHYRLPVTDTGILTGGAARDGAVAACAADPAAARPGKAA